MKNLKNSHFSRPHLSKTNLLLFALLFGLVGGYILLRTFALPNPNLPGDLNGDNTVGITDLSILLSNYNTTNPTADINLDGTVNILDLSILLSHYGTSYTPPPPPSSPGMPNFTAPTFTPTATVSATSASDFKTKVNQLVAGELLNVPAMNISGEVPISVNPSSYAEVHFASGVKFTGDAIGSKLPSVWVHDTSNVRFYGADVTGNGNDGIRFDDDTNVLWWDFVIHDTAGTGLTARGINHTISGLDLRGTIYNCGLTDDPNSPTYDAFSSSPTDPHPQKGTGNHGANVGQGTGQLLTNSRFVLTIHDQPFGAAIEMQGVQNSTLYLDARRITGNVDLQTAPWQPAPFKQVAGNPIEIWGDNTKNLNIKYLYGDTLAGRGVDIGGVLNSTNSGITVEYARVTNARLTPVYQTGPAITYIDAH